MIAQQIFADDLSRTQQESCRFCAKIAFFGEILEVSPFEKKGFKENFFLAKMRVTSVFKGDVKKEEVVEVLFQNIKGRKPKSPSLTKKRKYTVYLNEKKEGYFFLKDSWMAVPFVEKKKE